MYSLSGNAYDDTGEIDSWRVTVGTERELEVMTNMVLKRIKVDWECVIESEHVKEWRTIIGNVVIHIIAEAS